MSPFDRFEKSNKIVFGWIHDYSKEFPVDVAKLCLYHYENIILEQFDQFTIFPLGPYGGRYRKFKVLVTSDQANIYNKNIATITTTSDSLSTPVFGTFIIDAELYHNYILQWTFKIRKEGDCDIKKFEIGIIDNCIRDDNNGNLFGNFEHRYDYIMGNKQQHCNYGWCHKDTSIINNPSHLKSHDYKSIVLKPGVLAMDFLASCDNIIVMTLNIQDKTNQIIWKIPTYQYHIIMQN